jgi:glycosyltransferase involved in cell wall biosynthesis
MSIMNEPLVSVGLQFYNNESTLRYAIQSILNQTYQNWELILHNDGSTDGSYEIARSFSDQHIRLFTDAVNKGRPERLNESLQIARG